jgi:uncharacterized membrane protein
MNDSPNPPKKRSSFKPIIAALCAIIGFIGLFGGGGGVSLTLLLIALIFYFWAKKDPANADSGAMKTTSFVLRAFLILLLIGVVVMVFSLGKGVMNATSKARALNSSSSTQGTN